MATQRSGCNPLQVLLLCCISFLFGYTWRATGQYESASALVSELGDVPMASLCQNSSSRDLRLVKLQHYLTDLIDNTVGTGTILQAKASEADLEKLFRGALIHALAIDHFGCAPKSNVLHKSQLPKAGEKCDDQEQEVYKCLPATTDYMAGIARVNRTEFHSIIDTGVPLELSEKPEKDVLILYSSERAYAANIRQSKTSFIPTADALKNCQQLSVIHVKKERDLPNCWAILPGRESFHIQKWLRVAKKPWSKGNRTEPLRLVSRGYDPRSGEDHPGFPSGLHKKRHREWLGKYLLSVSVMVDELQPIVARIALNKQVIVMVCNSGQAELLLNFACAAKSRGLAIGHILVFAIDKETRDMAESLGMAAYYNAEFLGVLPSKDPKEFGDKTFTDIVIAKFMCTHLLSVMGYNFLFQDVDIVWYKDPLTFFNDPNLADPNFDIYFQDDVNGGIRYQPMRGNSGFYYVRHNERTVAAMKDAMMRLDQLFASRSHQQTLLEVLHESISYHGLRVKVYDAVDTDYFPLGAHFSVGRFKAWMQAFLRGEKDVFLFHMNWTDNKKEKVAFMRQLGIWYVQDQCSDKPLNTVTLDTVAVGQCCSVEPLFSCHYRDRPSLKPCADSPSYQKGNRPSWWE